jgi:hypothetical protein
MTPAEIQAQQHAKAPNALAYSYSNRDGFKTLKQSEEEATLGISWGPDDSTLPTFVMTSTFLDAVGITRISLGSVETVTGAMTVSSHVVTFEAPILGSIGGAANFSAATGLTSLVFPYLASVGGTFTLGTLPSLTRLVLDSLATVAGSLTLINDVGLTALSFPSLTSIAGAFALGGCTALAGLSLPVLATIGGTLTLTGNAALTALSLPLLTAITGSLAGSGCTLLASVSLPVLATVSADLILDTSALASLSLPLLTAIGGTGKKLSAKNSASLTTVSIPLLVPVNGNIIDFSGCALTAASVNHILARCVAAGITSGTVILTGGTNAAPTGQGITDKAALIAAGVTLTTT